VRIWDRGTCETETFSDNEIVALLRGERLDGRYAIFRTAAKLVHHIAPRPVS